MANELFQHVDKERHPGRGLRERSGPRGVFDDVPSPSTHGIRRRLTRGLILVAMPLGQEPLTLTSTYIDVNMNLNLNATMDLDGNVATKQRERREVRSLRRWILRIGSL